MGNFTPRSHLIDIKSRQGTSEYLPIQWRLVWFREDFPNGMIETEIVMIDMDRIIEAEQFVWNAEKRRNEKVMKSGKGFACFRATVKNGEGGSATATGSESAVDFSDFIEKSETKAIGRALAALGYGTQFAPELNEGNRLADAPVDAPAPLEQKKSSFAPQAEEKQSSPDAQPPEKKITQEQREAIRTLSEKLGKPMPEHMDALLFVEARNAVQKLTAEYRQKQGEQQKSSPASSPGWNALTQEQRTQFEWIKPALGAQFAEIVTSATLPAESKSWTVEQYTTFFEALNKVPAGATLITPLRALFVIYNTSAKTSLDNLRSRSLLTKPADKMTCQQALTLLAIFLRAKLLHDLGQAYDPNFVTFKEQYHADHPLDFYCRIDRKDDLERIQDYLEVLMYRYQKDPKKLQSELKEEHAAELAAWKPLQKSA